MRQSLPADGVAGPRTWAALRPWLVGYRRIRIVQGASFWRLARRYGISVESIAAANPELDPTDLPAGGEIVGPLAFEVVPTDISFTYEVLSLCIEGIAARYPDVRTGSFGHSVLGRELPRLTLGYGPHRVFYNAAHHANEWITTPLLMRFAERYAEAAVFDRNIGGRRAREQMAAVTLVIAPMVDPDGVDLVCGAFSPGSPEWLRAAMLSTPGIPFPSGWKANIEGVDLNLQYPALWERAREIKFAQGYTKPGPRDYVGPEPLAAPEARAVYELSVAEDFDRTLSWHTQGEVIYWQFSDFRPAGAEKLGLRLSEVSGYPLEPTPEGSAYAGYKDWFIQEYDRPGYTVEAGRGISPLPIRDFEEIWERNLGIMTEGISFSE
ncbi:MAG: LysM peptidoglycan-binding domain-containing protein, partial [Clostridia bacterium]|nr:LysM peptidoglycan-binding domain-containing protein [Clostridia bacterium]